MINLRYFILLYILVLFSCNENIVEIKDDNGIVIEKYTINKSNQKHGQHSTFDNKGRLIATSHYVNGQLEGEKKIYDKDGNLEIIETFKNNITDGPYVTLYPNGQVKFETVFEAGVLNSTSKSYSPDGKLKEIVTFKDNEENGLFKEFYDNGNIEWEGNYLNGDNEFGLLKHYNESGELDKKMICDSLAICRTIWTMADGDIIPKF